MNQQEEPGLPGTSGEVLCLASLKETMITEDWRPRSLLCRASYASKPPSQSVESYLYSLQTSHVLHGSCLSTCICLSWHLSVSQPESEEAARNCSTPPEVFWCISLYGVLTNAAQLCNVRQTNTCMLLAKNPSSRVLSCACFSRTSFHLCLLQQNILYPCLPQGDILSPLCLKKTSFQIINFAKN